MNAKAFTSPPASRWRCSWHSFRALPVWVQLWVGGILVPVNAASFALLDTWPGRATAVAALFVVASNLPIMLWARGMTRLMAVPHLFIWGALEILLLWHMRQASGGMAPLEAAYVWLVLSVNAISLVFDALDSWRWLTGERDAPGNRV
ncbi:hypothetical protein [Ralstonia pickettii]|jgi:hypothetical protein|uniref:Transmembrane protein n=1 Tax=Ralstonia pickettii TaxID=329 RepID=A0ABN9I3F1_RALPI|nr:hypothetical protein [Ralstonia pickettii]CAJ0723277.1 hypothetical protein R38712_01825 [Ralstonia pickettii]